MGSFTLQISVTLNTHQFLFMFSGKLYITDQRHSQYTSVFNLDFGGNCYRFVLICSVLLNLKKKKKEKKKKVFGSCFRTLF